MTGHFPETGSEFIGASPIPFGERFPAMLGMIGNRPDSLPGYGDTYRNSCWDALPQKWADISKLSEEELLKIPSVRPKNVHDITQYFRTLVSSSQNLLNPSRLADYQKEFVWGEIELPLIPEAWLQSIGRYTNSNKCSEDINAVSLELQSIERKRQVTSTQTPVEAIVSKLEHFFSLFPENSPELISFLETPLLNLAQTKPLRGLKSVPFLVTTWELLLSRFGSYSEIERELPLLTGSELMLRLNCLRASLDIAVTLPSWVHQDERGELKVISPLTPESLPEAYGLAGSRQVNQIGKDFSFSRTPSDLLKQSIAARIGIHEKGVLTLDEAGTISGITRERMRQICRDLPTEDIPIRRWPIPSGWSTLIDSLETSRDLNGTELLVKSHNLIKRLGDQWAAMSPSQLLELVYYYGHKLDLEIVDDSLIQRGLIPQELTKADIRKIVWKLSENTGFATEKDTQPDLIEFLEEVYQIEEGDELSDDLVNFISDWALSEIRLPDGYLFYTSTGSDRRGGRFLGCLNLIFSWTESVTSEEIQQAMKRYSVMRGEPSPPPVAVLEAQINRFSGFRVDNGIVSVETKREPETTTAIGFIAQLLTEAPGNVLHGNEILNEAREAGYNNTTASMFMRMGRVVKPVGSGCFALLGSYPTSEDIRSAVKNSNAPKVRESLDYSFYDGGIELSIMVGTNMRNSGVVGCPAVVRDAIADDKFEVRTEMGSHGKIAFSPPSALYGFAGALQVLNIKPGDSIKVSIDYSSYEAWIGIQ